MALKELFITKNCPADGDFVPRLPSVTRLSYISLLNTSPKLNIFTLLHLHFFLNLTPSLLNKILVKCQQATASDLPFYDIFAPQKVPLLKISDDIIACGLKFGAPPIKNPDYAYAHI